MDALVLARIQFAMTAGFHFIFPSLTIGLAWSLVVLEGIGYFKNNDDFKKIARYISKFFVITFAVGVASGIVMALQFGTNWNRFTNVVNDVFGVFLVAEVLFSFFLESFFVGLYVFGRGRISPFLQWFSILMVAIGTLISSFWILTAISWMHSPTGFELVNGKLMLTSFWNATFNPTMIPRFFHTVNATMIAAAFFLTGLSAYMILKNKGADLAKKLMGGAILFALITSGIELFPFGHLQVVNVAEVQKAKFATYEGVDQTSDNPPLLLFGIPDTAAQTVNYRIEIPGAMKYLFGESQGHKVTGLKDIPDTEKPPLAVPFISFHLMIMLGSFLILLSLTAFILHRRKILFDKEWFLRLLVWAIPLPVIIIQLGWMATEVGRQPWIIQGIMRTKDAVSILDAGNIVFSIILIGLVELLCLVLWLSLTVKTMKEGPESQGGRI
jgi:cytochrome bd ubiquinol oxidase subunit I